MRRELNRRILARVKLIKLNRDEAISTTPRRFQGWATSIPKGGSDAVKRIKEKSQIRKEISKFGVLQRRVAIDQTQKFAAALKEIIAKDEEAIAGERQTAWRVPGYVLLPNQRLQSTRPRLPRPPPGQPGILTLRDCRESISGSRWAW